VPLAVPFAKVGGYKALQDGAMVSQSMDPAVAGTCFSGDALESGFVDAAGYRIVGSVVDILLSPVEFFDCWWALFGNRAAGKRQ
jgi:hypothetical protein